MDGNWLSSVNLDKNKLLLVTVFLIFVVAGIYISGNTNTVEDTGILENTVSAEDNDVLKDANQVEDTISFEDKEISYQKLQNYNKSFDQKLYGFNVAKNGTLLIQGSFLINDSKYFIAEDSESNTSRVFLLEQDGYREIENLTVRKKVKGLKNLYVKTRFDPLFYSSYAENLSFSKYDDLKQRVFGPLFPHLEFLGQKNLYPRRFWYNLTTTIDKTDRFYNETSRKNALEMLRQYEKTSEAYERDLVDFLYYVNKSEFGDNSIGFANGGETTPKLLTTNLQKMSNNSRKLNEEIEERRVILDGKRNPELNLSRPKIDYNYSYSINKGVLDRDAIKTSFHELENFSWNFLKEAEVEGPYEVNMACIGEKRLLSRLEHPNASNRYPIYKLADGNMRVTRYVEKEKFNNSSDKEIIYNGTEMIGYLVGKDMAMLNCNCAYNNLAAVEWQLIDNIKEKLQEKSIYKGIEASGIEDERLKESIERGEKIEESIIRNPSIDNVEALGKNLEETRRLLYQYSQKNREIDQEILEKSEYMSKMEVLIDSKIPMMKYPLENYYHSTDSFRRTLYDGEVRESDVFAPTPGMLLDYSYYSLGYASFSDTVWRLNEQPQYWKPYLINKAPDRYMTEINQSDN